MTTADQSPVHSAWLPPEAFRAVGSRRVLVCGDGPLAETVAGEAYSACTRFGGVATWLRGTAAAGSAGEGVRPDLVLVLGPSAKLPAHLAPSVERCRAGDADALGAEGFALARWDGVTVVLTDRPAGLLYGFFHVVRLGETAFGADRPARAHRPAMWIIPIAAKTFDPVSPNTTRA